MDSLPSTPLAMLNYVRQERSKLKMIEPLAPYQKGWIAVKTKLIDPEPEPTRSEVMVHGFSLPASVVARSTSPPPPRGDVGAASGSGQAAVDAGRTGETVSTAGIDIQRLQASAVRKGKEDTPVYSMDELRVLANVLGLVKSGTKQDLVARILAAI